MGDKKRSHRSTRTVYDAARDQFDVQHVRRQSGSRSPAHSKRSTYDHKTAYLGPPRYAHGSHAGYSGVSTELDRYRHALFIPYQPEDTQYPSSQPAHSNHPRAQDADTKRAKIRFLPPKTASPVDAASYNDRPKDRSSGRGPPLRTHRDPNYVHHIPGRRSEERIAQDDLNECRRLSNEVRKDRLRRELEWRLNQGHLSEKLRSDVWDEIDR